MLISIGSLVLSLGIILLSCELFTNGIEWLGKRLKLGDGVVGSIFSAVGTCLPETMVPIIAISLSSSTAEKAKENVDIGIGAIMGAPFMLSTLAFLVTGLSVLAFWKRRKTGFVMTVNSRILSRDLGFFIIVYTIGLATSLVNIKFIKFIVALFLIAYYIYYIILTVKQDTTSHQEIDPLYIVKYIKRRPNMAAILFQTALALSGIVFGAHLFVQNIEVLSDALGIPALILSLIITPIATELPEKFNSIIWISKKKDTLALGNITGAMVFQSCIPVSIGIISTPWKLDAISVLSAVLAMLSALTVYTYIKLRGKLTPFPLLAGGVFYLVFIGYLIIK